MNRLAGKVALISGAAGGIGLASAELFAREGAHVVMTDLDQGRLTQSASVLANAGLSVEAQHHDVTAEEDWTRIVATTVAGHGRLDILVNNAGIGQIGDVEHATLGEWRRLLAVNLDAVFLGTQKAIEAMKTRGGSIINISSIEGLVGDPNLAAYNASKGGVRIFSKSAALHCAKMGYGIRVNSLHPGYTLTPMLTNGLATLPAEIAAAMQQDILSHIPLGRLAEPREIACAILFLASDESSYMTGAELVIDGGYTTR